MAGVPTNFILTTSHSANSSTNGTWSGTTSGASRYRVMTSEGKNGLPFLGQTTTAGCAHSVGGVDAQWIQQPVHRAAERDQVRPVHRRRRDDGRRSTPDRGRGALQAGTQAARDAVFASLNTLRTGGAPIGGVSTANVTVAAIAGSAPTAQNDAVDLLYKERAYWMWLTGHRLGDLRRLVRVYKRDSEAVFPTRHVTSPLDGTLRDEHHDHGARSRRRTTRTSRAASTASRPI